MAWRGPEYEGEFPSLGWAFIDWLEDTFRVPAGARAGEPLRLTPDQLSFFVRWYRIHPETGRRVYRRGSRRGSKGRGKSPEGAMYLAAEFCGPTVFDGWDAAGKPVAVPRWNPLCWAAATAEDQTENIYAVLREMLGEADIPNIDVGKTRIEFSDGRPGKIESVTASAGAREGAPITACALDESHLWQPSRGGDKLAAVIRRNLAKTGGTSIEFTNAPALGERSVAEATLRAATSAKPQAGLLYDSVEARWDKALDPKDPEHRDEVMRALGEAYDGVTIEQGGWVDIDRIYEEVMDVDTSRADVIRFYFNIADKAENRAFDTRRIRSLVKDRRAELTDAPRLLAFDGARTRDCAVFVAWTLTDVPHCELVQVWQRPHDPDADYEHPRGEIRAAVREFMADHDCVLFAYDSSFHELSSLYDEWLDEWGEIDGKGNGRVVGYPTASGQRMDHAIRRFTEDVREGEFTVEDSPVLLEHFDNAVLTKNRSGYDTLAKERDSLKIDGAVTAVFGYDLIPAALEHMAERRPKIDGPMVAMR